MQARLRLIMLYKQMITTLAEAMPGGSVLVQADHARSAMQLKIYAQANGRVPGGDWLEQRMAGIRRQAAEAGATADIQVDASGIAMLLELKV
jgi:hypothetical protein